MDLRESVRVAGRAIRAHKLRSGLTVLGVVIGIASVITVATFGASVQADVVSEIEGSSADNVYLLASPEDDGGFGSAFQPVFTRRDLTRLRETSGVRRVVPRGPVTVGSLSYRGDTVARSQVTATTPATFTEDGMAAGRAFRAGADEVVVNEAAVTAFEENLTVGSELVAVRGDEEVELEVVGVAARTEGQLPFASFGGQPRFFVPTEPFYDTAVESPSVGANQRAYPQVTVVADPARTTEVKANVRTFLREESDARQLVPAGVEVTAQTSGDFVDRIQDVVNRITRFVTGIAVISLVVGAVGIANIMLVSVTERTREIGVMKAVGARNRDVMRLFLVEAALLGLAGALVGIPLGALAAYGATVYAEVGFTLALDWLAVAVAVGLGVGVLAGVYPAWRAARVDPIDALRYE